MILYSLLTTERFQSLSSAVACLQTLRGVGGISAVVLIAEMGSFNLFDAPEKLYAYLGLDQAIKQFRKFTGNKIHMSKHGFSLARRNLHMVALNNLKADKGTKQTVNLVKRNTMFPNVPVKRRMSQLVRSFIRYATSSFPCSGTISHLS